MPNESLQELFEQMSKVRRVVRQAAEKRLRKETKARWTELVDNLRQPQPHRHSRAVLECLFQYPSPALLRELSFLVDHPSDDLRHHYAHFVAETGKMYALPLIGRFLQDPVYQVRLGATNGLSDRSERSFTKPFARKAAPLLFQYICDFPDDDAPWRRPALEIFAPRLFAKLEAQLEKSDQLRRFVREAFDAGEQHDSHRQAISGGFDSYPPAYKYIWATNYVDAEIRNGGISQLYANSAWVLMIDAIEGTRAFGCRKLSQTLREIVFYYHRKGRSKLKRRTPEGYFDTIAPRWSKQLDQLENEYYQCFEKLHAEDIWDLWSLALEKTPGLFSPAPQWSD